MNSIINYFIESGIALGIFSLFYLMALKQEKSFVFNRFYLLGSTALSLVLPFIHFQLESVPTSLVAGTILLETLDFSHTEATTSLFSSLFWVSAYLLVAALLLFRTARKVIPLLTARKHAITKSGYRLCLLHESSAAYTFWDTIYLGDQLEKKEKALILSHEEIHAKQRHSLDIIFFEIASALFWINPLFLIIKKLARANHEYLADAKAVNHIDRETYVQILANHAIQKHGFLLAHSFHTSSTLKRIKMINQQNNQIMKIKQVLPFVLGLTLIFVFGCQDAAEQLSQQDDIKAAKTIQEYAMKNGAYDMVDEQPDPANGMTEFYTWVANNLKYPTQARKEGVEGRVFIEFVVDESGNLTNVKALKGIGSGCDQEAIRVVEAATKWNPGKIEGKPVPVRMVLPVSFKLKG